MLGLQEEPGKDTSSAKEKLECVFYYHLVLPNNLQMLNVIVLYPDSNSVFWDNGRNMVGIW
jgi:hypothetical protein